MGHLLWIKTSDNVVTLILSYIKNFLTIKNNNKKYLVNACGPNNYFDNLNSCEACHTSCLSCITSNIAS